jgi:hypothetical protein
MRGLLVRVGIDSSDEGRWNAPVDSKSRSFAYVPIAETKTVRQGFERSYDELEPALRKFDQPLPAHLVGRRMHLDPDFETLTYGDQGSRADQILSKLAAGDLLVFYAGLRDVNANPRLVYAIIGLYVIDAILPATMLPQSCWHENAHTRRALSPNATDVVARARKGVSGRLTRCLPIGSYRAPVGYPNKHPSYRVEPSILAMWGGLSVADGWLQRSARLLEFQPDASRFHEWFKERTPELVAANNPTL